MFVKLLGFSQTGDVRRFTFHRICSLGAEPVPFCVLADTMIARKLNLHLQELPSLCARLLDRLSDDAPAATLTLGESDMYICAVAAMELDKGKRKLLRYGANRPPEPA